MTEAGKKEKKCWGANTFHPSTSWRRECTSCRALGRTLCGLLGMPRARHFRRPIHAIRPIPGKPADNFVVFLRRERLAIANPGEEAAICGAVAPDRGLAEFARVPEAFRKCEQMISEFGFHDAFIVGSIPLFNGKLPIRVGRGKFPMVFA